MRDLKRHCRDAVAFKFAVAVTVALALALAVAVIYYLFLFGRGKYMMGTCRYVPTLTARSSGLVRLGRNHGNSYWPPRQAEQRTLAWQSTKVPSTQGKGGTHRVYSNSDWQLSTLGQAAVLHQIQYSTEYRLNQTKQQYTQGK